MFAIFSIANIRQGISKEMGSGNFSYFGMKEGKTPLDWGEMVGEGTLTRHNM